MFELAEWALGLEPYDAPVFRDRLTVIEVAAPIVRAGLHEHLPGVTALLRRELTGIATLVTGGTR